MIQPPGPLDDLVTTALHDAIRLAAVLVVEPCLPLRGALRAVLRQEGYLVLEAGSTSEAHRLLAEREVDLLVVDLCDPVVARWTASRPRSRPRSGVPVLGIAESPGSRALPRSVAGVDALLHKPFSARQLLRAVDAQLGASRPPLPVRRRA